jgi:hypothetical protein
MPTEIDRRRFNRMLGAAAMGGPRAFAGNFEPEVIRLTRNGWCPNNARLLWSSAARAVAR